MGTGWILRLITAATVILLAVPIVVVLLASLSSGATAVFPPRGLSFQSYIDLLSQTELQRPVLASAYVGVVSAVLAMLIGVPAGLALNRYRVKARGLLNAILALGFATPLTVSAVGYLLVFTQMHLSGDLTATAFALTVVNLPFMLWSIAAAVGVHNPELEDAASILGADELKQFILVTIPGIAPGIILGMFMLFIFGITEFTMSVILVSAGNATLPVYMFSSLRGSLSTNLAAVGTLYIAACVLIFYCAVRFGKLEQFLFRANIK